MNISGRIHLFGDHIDTDVILPTHAIVTTDNAVLARHCFTGLVQGFAGKVQRGDIIFAGENFGCGSSREHAPLAIKACGIGAVVAASFSRLFYRNAINIGLPAVECPESIKHAVEGELASVELDTCTVNIGGRQFRFQRYPQEVLEILRLGGLVPFMKQRLNGGQVNATS